MKSLSARTLSFSRAGSAQLHGSQVQQSNQQPSDASQSADMSEPEGSLFYQRSKPNHHEAEQCKKTDRTVNVARSVASSYSSTGDGELGEVSISRTLCSPTGSVAGNCSSDEGDEMGEVKVVPRRKKTGSTPSSPGSSAQLCSSGDRFEFTCSDSWPDFSQQLAVTSGSDKSESDSASDSYTSDKSISEAATFDQDAVVQGVTEPGWSVGAELHLLGECRPCVWMWTSMGCINDSDCTFCHMCSKDVLKQRRRERFMRMRRRGKDNAAAPREHRNLGQESAASLGPPLEQDAAISSAQKAKPGADPNRASNYGGCD